MIPALCNCVLPNRPLDSGLPATPRGFAGQVAGMTLFVGAEGNQPKLVLLALTSGFSVKELQQA